MTIGFRIVVKAVGLFTKEQATKIMLSYIKQLLEQANKLIFVKKYHQAAKLLDQILGDGQGQKDVLVHLRRIELATKINELTLLKDLYTQRLESKKLPEDIAELCLAFIELHSDVKPVTHSVQRFREVMKRDGESAAAYFGIALSLEFQGNLERAIFNYKESLKHDAHWYPSYFGLSQAYYQQDDEVQGDHYFFLFEKYAPFNLYGNFETHKRLCYEFLDMGKFEEAEVAMTSLGEWWTENKKSRPLEIKIYERFTIAKIADRQGDVKKSQQQSEEALFLSEQALRDTTLNENVLYFVAKTLEEFGHFEVAFRFYKKIVKIAGDNPAMVQKIGGQFLALGEYKLAKELFEEAYRASPDNAEIRFCRLITELKQSNVDVEDYLLAKEKLRGLVEHGGDKVELLSLLHNLMARFKNDPDVHLYMGEIYLHLGNIERAATHFERMYELDNLSLNAALKLAAFLLQKNDLVRAGEILHQISANEQDDLTQYLELTWLRSQYYFKAKDYQSALGLVKNILQHDPWNVSYLVYEILCLTKTKYPDNESLIDKVLLTLGDAKDAEFEWHTFHRVTEFFVRENEFEIAYGRAKLFFLYDGGSEAAFRKVIGMASHYDCQRGTHDFLRLLNTNFDSPLIYFGLGVLAKGLWQLETSCMWLEQLLQQGSLSSAIKGEAYLEAADSYIWRNMSFNKAIEYVKFASTLNGETSQRAQVILSHAYLRLGQIRQAQTYLDQAYQGRADHEANYLQGLLHYRNGQVKKAKIIWKPLLTVRSDDLRFHHMKQEILKYYFEGESYLKAN